MGLWSAIKGRIDAYSSAVQVLNASDDIVQKHSGVVLKHLHPEMYKLMSNLAVQASEQYMQRGWSEPPANAHEMALFKMIALCVCYRQAGMTNNVERFSSAARSLIDSAGESIRPGIKLDFYSSV